MFDVQATEQTQQRSAQAAGYYLSPLYSNRRERETEVSGRSLARQCPEHARSGLAMELGEMISSCFGTSAMGGTRRDPQRNGRCVATLLGSRRQ